MTALHEARQFNETSSFEFNGTESNAACDFCNFTVESNQKLEEQLRKDQNDEQIKRTEEALIYVIVVVAFYLTVLLVAIALSLRQQLQQLWFIFGSYHKRCDYSILDQFEEESKQLAISSKHFSRFGSQAHGHISNI